MESKRINHKPILQHFRMICNRSGAVHVFKAFTASDARCQARVFFDGPVNHGGRITSILD